MLIIDTDPQSNATKNLYSGQKADITIKDLFHGMDISKVIHESVEAGLDIIPSCKSFSVVEQELSTRLAGEKVLYKALKPIEQNYDVIIIDTQPSIGLIPINALYASDEVIIPVYENYAVDAMNQMVGTVYQVRQELEKEIIIGGILLTMYDPRTNLAKEVLKNLKTKYGSVVFDTMIHRDVNLAKCPEHNQSIFEYAPDSAGAKAYEALTDELLVRWGMV